MTDANTPTSGPRAADASTHAYTRAAVDEYLHAIWLRRQALEAEITTARGRTAKATRAVSRLDSLERAVGKSLVSAYAQHVAALRRREGHVVSPPRAPEAIIDLTDEPESDPLAGLLSPAPDGFGDEFFGPSPASAHNGNGHGNGNGAVYITGARRG
jgi:hypothetical protein